MKFWKTMAVATVATGLLTEGTYAQGVAGSYLAGRHARYQSDFSKAAQYYTMAITRDAGNPALLESAVQAQISLGKIERAVPIARRLEADARRSQIAHMALIADDIWNNRYDQVMLRIEEKRGLGRLIDGLLKAWSHLGNGAMSDAEAEFDRMAQNRGQRGFALYQKALALALVGNFEASEALLSQEGPNSVVRTRRGVIARLQVLSQLGRNKDALDVLKRAFGESPDPELSGLKKRLEADETLDFTIVGSVRDGMAEVLYTVGGALRGEAHDRDTLLFVRLAAYLRPDHVDAILLSADLLERLKQYDLATEAYRSIPQDHAAFHAAEIGRAEALRKAGKKDAAVEVLEALARSHGGVPSVHSTLGDMLRSLNKYGAASKAYDRALELTKGNSRNKWFLYYARGICFERSGEWPKAEADFRKALEINPGRPEVLNYLGYSLVQKKSKLEEALNMIERAVAARPNSGYIVDSLGWVLYRLGRYDEAVKHMERATELMPVDPVVNDHLGDVYWAVGRFREAEFQWKRALSFVNYGESSEEVKPERIRRKLEVGLDKVLEEEGADPIKLVDDKG